MEQRVTAVRGGTDGPASSAKSGRLDCGHTIPTFEPGSDPEARPGDSPDSRECRDCDDRLRPSDYSMGRRTPEFTADTVPKALLKAHRATTWAELIVFEGAVLFTEAEPSWRATAWEKNPVTIVPNREHEILPSPDARFAIQFFDAPAENEDE